MVTGFRCLFILGMYLLNVVPNYAIAPTDILQLFQALSAIETLTGSNYKKWKPDIKLVIGLMDLDCIF